MGENSSIQWCDHTFNPWEGCSKVSPGCAHCYAETRNHRFGLDNWGKGKPRRRTSASNWKKPLQWNRAFAPGKCVVCGRPAPIVNRPCDCGVAGMFERPRVFCASLADWLDDEVPIEWLTDLLKLIHDTPNLDWLLLTKRPENWRHRIARASAGMRGWPARDMAEDWLNDTAPSNVWLGTSVEDQQRADERIPELLKIPARVRFLSVEPMLGEVDLELLHGCRGCNHPGNIVVAWNESGRCSVCDGTGQEPSGIHWVIYGGESGKNARPCNVEWIRDGVMQCRAAGVAPFVKQLGGHVAWNGMSGPGQHWPNDRKYQDSGSGNWYVPLKDPKGGDMSEWPEDLRIREFPKVEVPA